MSDRTFEILVVEDNPGDVDLLEEALSGLQRSHRLHVATNGIEALKVLKPDSKNTVPLVPDLIVLDLNLPLMDGYQVLKALRGEADLARLPVVILTSSHFETQGLFRFGLPADCYIRKPIDFEHWSLVANQLDRILSRLETKAP